MNNFTQFCGVDVSKRDLDYCLRTPQNPQGEFSKLKNDLQQIESSFSDPKFQDTLFILEHTGNYSSKLIYQLNALNLPMFLVNPSRSKAYMQAQGITNKNDKQAAHSLSLMGEKLSVRLYKVPTQEMQKRKQTMTSLTGLKKQHRMLSNQIHALDQLAIIDEISKAALETVLQTVNEQIAILEKQVYVPSQDPDYNEKKKYATSVKGIGEKTAEAILLATNGLDGFHNPDQLSKFLGLTPGSHRSGTSVRKRGRISKTGSSEIRALLYMCTGSAKRYNNPCKELNERLRKKGKPHKVIAIAIMHKLVKQIFGCVTTKTLFDNDFHLKKTSN